MVYQSLGRDGVSMILQATAACLSWYTLWYQSILSSTDTYTYPQSHNTFLHHNVYWVPRRRNQDISVTFYLDQSQDSVRIHAHLGPV